MKKKEGSAIPLRDMTIQCLECGRVILTSCVSYSCSWCRTDLLHDDYHPTKDVCRVISSVLKQA